MQDVRKRLGIALGLVLLLGAVLSSVHLARAISEDTPMTGTDQLPSPGGEEERPVTTLTPAIPNWPVLARSVAANEIRPATGGRFAAFTLAVVNTGQDPVKLRFNTGQRYDFLVIDSRGREIWRWSRSRAFIQMLSEVTAAPKQLLAYTVVWDGKADDGNPVAAGEYWVQGVLTSDPWAATEPVRFTWHGN